MEKVLGFAERLCDKRGSDWQVDGKKLIAPVGRNGRFHKIRFWNDEGSISMTTIVLDARSVTENNKRWREIAMLAWKRNAECDLVSFQFDQRERLIGRITHPEAHLDFEEFEIYVETLAIESDRFEYLLTGRDRW